jgi:uncharacterized protein YbjT (DUF2867 family)
VTELPTKVAWIAGASGFVGGHLLDALLGVPEYGRVYAVSRRPLGREHPRLANRIVQFDRLEAQLKGSACHDAFCCLGTTIAEAGSQEAFRQVDVGHVLAFARAAREAQAQRFIVVSSVGADPRSPNFYLSVKGEMEQEVSALGFASVDIMQPGLLLGWRSEMRPFELAGRLLMPLVNPFLIGRREGYRGIHARTLAEAMLGAARSSRRGVTRHTYPAMRALAASRPVRTAATAKQHSANRRA